MKYSNLIVAAMLGLGLSAQAAIFYQGTPGNGQDLTDATSSTLAYSTIADGNPGGIWNSISVSGLGNSLSAITVTLNVTGGRNNGLYAYLTYNGTLAVLLNRPGVSSSDAFGSQASGLNRDFTMIDANSAVNPLSSTTSFTGVGSTTLLNNNSIYGGKDPNGVWTLFFADVSAGGGPATLNGWSLDITAVPEPVNVALAGFAGVMLTVVGVRRYLRTNKTV